MRGYFILALLVFLVHLPTTSFAAVTGTVSDMAGNPVPEAAVTFFEESNPGNRFTDITDEVGRFEIDLSASTAVGETAPMPFVLGQNYPNPFNPATTIPFTLDAPAHVSIAVYTVIGQRIATIADEYLDAGHHTVTWNGYDDQGNHLGAGVYLYRLRAETRSETRKMLLVDGGAATGAASGGAMSMRAISGDPALKPGAATYTITITGSGLLPYRKAGVTLAGDERYDVVVTGAVPLGIALVPLGGGTFRMGNTNDDPDYFMERPVHTVTLSPFEMSAHEITQGQYEAVMGMNPARAFGVGESHPVYYVCWCEAVQFCNRLSDRAGLNRCYNEETWECDFTQNGFRLPTEAEWEYACRGGTETKYYMGDDVDTHAESGWFEHNSDYQTHPVGQRTPNAFGLYDMYGNVLELCHDWYGEDYYASSPATDPTGPETGERRVLRGGSHFNEADTCRSAGARFSFSPQYPGGISSSGFRVVRRP